MKRSMRLSQKLTLYLLGFSALLLVLLWLFQTVLLGTIYKQIRTDEAKSAASIVADNIDNEDLDTLLQELSERFNVSILLSNHKGTMLYNETNEVSRFTLMTPQERTALLVRVLSTGDGLLEFTEHGAGKTVREFDSRNFQWRVQGGTQSPIVSILLGRVLTDIEGRTVILLIDSAISPVDATVETLKKELYWITGVLLISSILLAIFMARHISRPIETLNLSARRLSSGHEKPDFRARGYREIEELSQTLDEASRELARVEELRRELLANITHDLRTPLSLIAGYAEAMRDLPNENTGENAQVILDEARRLGTLVSDFLDISQYEQGGRDPSLQPLDLSDLLAENVNRLKALTRDEGYHITLTVDDEAWVRADEKQIAQALYNLLLNAIHYTGENHKVFVTQTVSHGRVRVEVTDTGDGISPEEQGKIWTRYYRGTSSHRRAVTGSGLGLSIVEQIFVHHDARYGVISSKGHGATFWFELSLLDPNI